jgi:hypothetical protein
MPTGAERQAEAARRRAQVVQLRLAGASFEEIGRQLGVSDTRAHQLWIDALDRTAKEPADRWRELELQRLDQLQAAATAVLQATHHVIQAGKVVLDNQDRPYVDHGPTLAAVTTLVRVMERRARLLGLDAPARVDATVDGTLTTVDAIDREIERIERELATLDAGYLADKQRRDGAARDLSTFRTRWQQPGHRPLADVAGFIADALELALGQLDLDPAEREQLADTIERFLAAAGRG